MNLKTVIFTIGCLSTSLNLSSQETLLRVGLLNNIISEPSGIGVLYNTADGHFDYWLHNDKDYPESIYSIRLDESMNIKRTIDVTVPYIDWEDMTSDGLGNIYLGDFGNWVGADDQLQVVKIPNPSTYQGTPPTVEIIKYTYPFTGVSDMEAMFHLDGYLYLFTKSVNINTNPSLDPEYTYCFRIPDQAAPGDGEHTAELVSSFKITKPDDVLNQVKITSADISPDKKTMAFLSYSRIWVFSCFEGNDFFNGEIKNFEIDFRQYEGISFINNHEIIISKEGDPDNVNNNPIIYYHDIYPWIKSDCLSCEKTQNGNFSEENMGWTKFENGTATADVDISDGRATIDVLTTGDFRWQLNLRQKSIILEKNKNYKISYSAYADNDRDMSVIMNEASGNTGYFYAVQDLTTVDTEYHHEFTMTEDTDFNTFFSFNVGNSTGKIYLDDVRIVEVECESLRTAALPIELLSFSATNHEKQVLLTWETETEINNDYFDIETSIDGINFEVIGTVMGSNTANHKHRYEFTHTTPIKGQNFYRLNQVDLDGKSSYTSIRSVHIKNFKDEGKFTLYPNPVTNELSISSTHNLSNHSIRIYDMAGPLLNTLHYTSGMKIDVFAFDPGLYFFEIINRTGQIINWVKVVKL